MSMWLFDMWLFDLGAFPALGGRQHENALPVVHRTKIHTPNEWGARASSGATITTHHAAHGGQARVPSQRRSPAGKSFKVAPVSKCSTKIRPTPRVKVAAVAHETAKPIKTLGGVI